MKNPSTAPQAKSEALSTGGIVHGDMTLRDCFAIHAPQPDRDQILLQRQIDRSRNPHNDTHKPPIRSEIEIIADLAFEYADAMLKARRKP